MVHKLVYLINIEKKEKATAFLIHTIDLTSRWQHESSVGSISGSSSLQATATGAPIPSNRRSLIAQHQLFNSLKRASSFVGRRHRTCKHEKRW